MSRNRYVRKSGADELPDCIVVSAANTDAQGQSSEQPLFYRRDAIMLDISTVRPYNNCMCAQARRQQHNVAGDDGLNQPRACIK